MYLCAVKVFAGLCCKFDNDAYVHIITCVVHKLYIMYVLEATFGKVYYTSYMLMYKIILASYL